MSTITMNPIPENRIADAIASQIVHRKRQFKKMLSALADGAEVPPGQMIDTCIAAKIDPDSLPAAVQLVLDRRALHRATAVDAAVVAEREALEAEVEQLAQVETKRLAEAEKACERYGVALQGLMRNIQALSHHFSAAEDARSKLASTVDSVLAAKAADLVKVRRSLSGAARSLQVRAEQRQKDSAPPWEIGEMRAQIRDIETKLADLDREFVEIERELSEIL